MGNNIEKDLQDFTGKATEMLTGLGAMVEAMKKDLTPEQQVKVDEELKKVDIKSAIKDLDNANKDLGDFINKK